MLQILHNFLICLNKLVRFRAILMYIGNIFMNLLVQQRIFEFKPPLC